MKFKSMLALILAIVMCVLLAACSKAETSKQKEETTTTVVAENVLVQSAELTESEKLLFSQDGVFNLLLSGVDNINDIGAADTIMLMSIDRTRAKIKFTSFAKDTYVSIPNYGENALGVAYSLGGTSLLVNTIEHNFGIDIHRFALLNYFTFADIVDILGPMEIELTEKDVECINSLLKAEGESETVSAKSGKIKLNGKQTLAYLRTDGGKGSVDFDFVRTERQRTFLMNVVKMLSSASADKLLRLAKDTVPYLHTDLTNDEMNALVKGIRIYLLYSQSGLAVPSADNRECTETDTGVTFEIKDWGKARTDLKKFIYE